MAEETEADIGTILNDTVFSQLDSTTQENILKRSIVFQGKHVSLRDVLTPSRGIDLDEIINSDLLSKLNNNEEITVGRAMDHIDEELHHHYINRSFHHEESIVSEEQLCKYKEDRWHQIFTILNPPGSGKSKVLDRLAITMKKNYPYLWVIKIDLKNYSGVLSTFKEKKMRLVSLVDLLNSREDSRITDDFERKVFRIPHKVVLIVDGMDEIYSDYKDIIGDIMSDYHKIRNLARVYVAGSNNMDESLRKQLWSSSQLVALSEEDQIVLLKSHLEKGIHEAKDKEKLKIYAEKLVRDLWLVEDENALVGIPLQIKMLSEVICGIENCDVETSLDLECFYDFLSLGNDELSIPKKISLARLYMLYIHRSCCEYKTSLNEDLLKEDIAKLNEKHQYGLYVTALENLFINECELFSCYKNRVPRNWEELVELNIVQEVGDQLCFSHRTLAEYFVADCIASELRQIESKEFLKFFVEVILTRHEFRLVRLFLDSLIGAVLNSISNNTLKDIGYMITENENTFLHYLLKEGCVEIFKFLLKCLNLSGLHLDFDVIRLQGKTLLQTAISAGQFNILETLVELGAPVKSRDDGERTALYSAVSKDDLKAAKFLVQHGAEVHCRDVTGRTPLHEAATSCSLDMLEFLLSHGAAVDCRDRDGRTPFHEAVKNGRLDRVEYLVQKGGDVNSKAKTGTPLFDVVSEGHLSIVKYLLEKGAKVTFTNEKGGTVLYKASKYQNYYECRQPIKPQSEETRKNSVEIYKLLINTGIDVNSLDRTGNTALHSHIDRDDNIQLVKLLVESGAEINRFNKSGQSALNIAIRFDATEIVSYLLKRTAPTYSKSLLYVAVSKGYLEVVKYFEERGVDLNFRDEYGSTLLHTAVNNGNLDMVKYLVEKGVDINGKSYGVFDGVSVLGKAMVNNCSIDIIKYLIEHGAKVDNTLQQATAKGDIALVKFLEENGATADLIHNVGRNFELLQYLTEKGVEISPFFIAQSAAENGDLNIIKHFIDRGIDIYQNKYGNTKVLHTAAKYNQLEIVKLLVKHGADMNYKDCKDETPLNKAFRHDNLEIAEYLVEKGADIKNVLGENREMLLQVIYAFNKVKFLVDRIEKINIYKKPEKYVFAAVLAESRFDTAEYLVEKSEGNETIADVVKRFIEAKDNVLGEIFKQWGTVRYLLEKGTCIGSEEIEKFNLLVKAALKNDFKYVRYLVEKGADVNQKNEQSRTSLHETSDFRIVKYLIEKGADVNAKTEDGWSVLHEAIKSRSLDVCEFLVEKGAKIDSTILDTAVTKGTYNKVKYLLGRGVNFTIEESNKALREAVTFNDFDLVECLIENGAEIEDRDRDDRTAIFKAVDSGNLDMVKYLAKRGANINVEDKNSTLFQLAVAKADLDIIRYLISSGVDITVKGKSKPLLHSAVSNGNFEMVKFLLENGIDVATVDQDGRTVLHEAAKSGNSHLGEYLLNHGAPKEFEVKDKLGRTVLQESLNSEENALRVLKVLVEHGADVNAKFKGGLTLLHEAVLKFNGPVAEYLIESGADVNAKTKTGRTALLDASLKGNLEFVHLLVKNGADVHVQDGEGYTALHEATRSYDYGYWFANYDNVMEFLIENGAAVDVKSRDGHCPLEDAVAKFDTVRIKVLVENGAEIGADSKNYKRFLEALERLGIKR